MFDVSSILYSFFYTQYYLYRNVFHNIIKESLYSSSEELLKDTQQLWTNIYQQTYNSYEQIL